MTARYLRNTIIAALAVLAVGTCAQLARQVVGPWIYLAVVAFAVSAALIAHMDAVTWEAEQ